MPVSICADNSTQILNFASVLVATQISTAEPKHKLCRIATNRHRKQPNLTGGGPEGRCALRLPGKKSDWPSPRRFLRPKNALVSQKSKGTNDLTVTGPFTLLEAPGGLEPPMEALQAPALPTLLRRRNIRS